MKTARPDQRAPKQGVATLGKKGRIPMTFLKNQINRNIIISGNSEPPITALEILSKSQLINNLSMSTPEWRGTLFSQFTGRREVHMQKNIRPVESEDEYTLSSQCTQILQHKQVCF